MKSSYLYLNDLRIHYMHWNRDGDTAVLLLHGLASNARIWEIVAPLLAQEDLAVYAPEARGHGRSDKPDGDYSFEAVTRDLSAFIKATHLENPLLVGHSWGASVALDYAARVPFGPHASKGIVLVDGGFIQLDDSKGADWETIRQRLSPPPLAGTPVESFLAHLEEMIGDWLPPGPEREQIISIILANFEIDEEERIKPHLTFDRHMQIVRAMWEFQTYQRYSQVRCPVLMVPARPAKPGSERELEFLAAKEAGIQRAQNTIKNLQVHWMDDSIHDIPLQHSRELAGLITTFAAELA